jgi:hypothetical protein
MAVVVATAFCRKVNALAYGPARASQVSKPALKAASSAKRIRNPLKIFGSHIGFHDAGL